MKKTKNSKLTSEMLKEWGIVNITWDEVTNNWKIERYWHKTSSKEMSISVMKIQKAVCKHKYTADKEYPIVGFSAENKHHCIPLARLIYAWFYGEVPEGMEIDHIDNDPFNNNIDNLQIVSVEENLKKRFQDNPDACRNQFDAIKKKELNIRISNSYKEAQSILVDITNMLTEIGKSKPNFAEKELELLVEDLKDRYNDVVRYE